MTIEKSEQFQTEKMVSMYEHMISATGEHMSFLDQNYIYQTVNNAYLQDFQKTPQQIIGHSVSDLLGKDVFKQVAKENLDRCLAGEKINYQAWFEFPVSGKRYMDVSYYPSYDVKGEVVGIVVRSCDITEQKLQEDLLRETKNRYQQIFETNMAVRLIIDPDDGLIVNANKAACQFYGYDNKAITSLRMKDINTLSSEQVQLEMDSAKKEKRLFFNFRHRLASGEIRDVEVYSGPLESGDKTLLYSIIHDVTEQRQNHIKLVETNKELEQAVAQIKALSSALEHRVQLRTFELQESNEQLEQKKEEIQKNNIALRVLLDQHQSTREEIEDQVSARLKKLVYPYLDLLRHEVSNELRKEYLAIITSHLDSITEPFTKKLANPLWHLTPREILVADLVKQGKRTKEIGQVLKISPRTAERYRNNIRKKIGITKKKISLSAYLNSLSTST